MKQEKGWEWGVRGLRGSVLAVMLGVMLLSAPLLRAGDAASWDVRGVEIGASGVLQFGAARLFIDIRTLEGLTSFKQERLAPVPGYPVQTEAVWETQAAMPASFEVASSLSEKIVRGDGQNLSVDYAVTLGNNYNYHGPSLACDVPVTEVAGPLEIDGTALPLPKTLCPTYDRSVFDGSVLHTLAVPMASGTLFLKGNFLLSVHDDRRYGAKTFRLTISLARKNPKRGECHLAIRFDPNPVVPVSLAEFANLGPDDPIRGGKSGRNELTSLDPGVLGCGNTSFQVLDPDSNGGKCCVAMNASEVESFPHSLLVPIYGRPGLQELCLLHALTSEPSSRIQVATVTVCFLNGSEKKFGIFSGRDVGSWIASDLLAGGGDCWKGPGRSGPAMLYVSRLPLPGDPVTAVKLDCLSNVNWVVAGITGDLP